MQEVIKQFEASGLSSRGNKVFNTFFRAIIGRTLNVLLWSSSILFYIVLLMDKTIGVLDSKDKAIIILLTTMVVMITSIKLSNATAKIDKILSSKIAELCDQSFQFGMDLMNKSGMGIAQSVIMNAMMSSTSRIPHATAAAAVAPAQEEPSINDSHGQGLCSKGVMFVVIEAIKNQLLEARANNISFDVDKTIKILMEGIGSEQWEELKEAGSSI